MITWWNALTIEAQIFACMAIPATLILLIQTVLMLLGIGDEGGDGVFGEGSPFEVNGHEISDAVEGVFGENFNPGDHDISGLDGLRILSVRGIIAFFVVFGWMGVALSGAGLKLAVNILISFAAGFITMVLIALLMRWVMRLQSNGTMDIRNALGCGGRIYLTVPEMRRGQGKVNVTVQGQLREFECVTDMENPIPTGAEVTVIGISGGDTLVVTKK